MKNMKKILALVIAALMIVSMASIALADGNSITITGGKKGHTYTAYQIFSGTYVPGAAAVGTPGEAGYVAATAATLVNIQWGNGVTSTFINGRNAAVVAEAMSSEQNAKDMAAAIVANNKAGLGTAAGSVALNADGNAVISGLADGYYLVIDTATTGGTVSATDDIFSQYIVNLVGGSVTVASKSDTPSSEKKVKDNDYTTDDGAQKTGVAVGAGYNDAADYNIGDAVPFELFGTLPSNYDEYATYKYKFTDTASDGLDINADSVHVYIDGTEVTTGFTKTVAANKHSMTIAWADLKQTAATKDSKIKVTFTATLNTSAEIGLDGNTNKVDLEFSNNPTDGGEGTSKTPEDEVLVFTYELDVDKVDGSNTELKLTKAQFVLKATSGDHSGKYVLLDANYKVSGWTETKPTAIPQDDVDLNKVTTEYNQAGILVSTGDGAEFKVIGLDAGNYELEEIQAPKGYNLLETPIEIQIIATQANLQNYKDGTTDAANEVLTKLEIDVDGTKSDGNTTTGIVATTVTNNSGTTLPSTGGIGTTLFYIGGSILVLAAVILLITKRRMSSND